MFGNICETIRSLYTWQIYFGRNPATIDHKAIIFGQLFICG